MDANLGLPITHQVSDLIGTFDLPLRIPDDEVHLRIEIFRCVEPRGHYYFRVWRYEHYRIQATFPQEASEPSHPPSDELILKEFEGLDGSIREPQPFTDGDAARLYVLQYLSRWLERVAP